MSKQFSFQQYKYGKNQRKVTKMEKLLVQGLESCETCHRFTLLVVHYKSNSKIAFNRKNFNNDQQKYIENHRRMLETYEMLLNLQLGKSSTCIALTISR